MLENDPRQGAARNHSEAMYVKLYNQILDSSLADNRKLRHFFTDLLLCSDPDGNVIMTKEAIRNRIRATLEEVEWGIEELMKPDAVSLTPDHDGRRIIPLEGHGYGWKIINYSIYRDYKSAQQMREASAERVRKWRENQAKKPKKLKRSKPLAGEQSAIKAAEAGNVPLSDAIESGGRTETMSLEEAEIPALAEPPTA